MKLRLKNMEFSNNISFYAKITRKCLVCDSTKVYSNELGVYCDDCGAAIDYEESSCCRT